MSVKEKAGEDLSGEEQGDERNRTADEVSKHELMLSKPGFNR